MKLKKIIGILILAGTAVTMSSCSLDSFTDLIDKYIKNDTSEEKDGNSSEEIIKNDGVIYDDFQIHFMMLGNDKAGDSIYIKAGDNDILIDAGSEVSSSETIEAYVDKYCLDKKLEYVIATHGDSDHIAAFPKIFDYYSVDTVIDFTYTTKTTSTYNKYLMAREKASKHYTTKECWNNENGAQRKYVLGTGSNGEEISFELLYNYYYFVPATDENNNSVVTMFNYGDKHFFLGGDLEKEGEEKLAEYYDSTTAEKTLPQVELYKAGHHGSKTSSNDCLLSLIKPKMSVVSCCCGTDEYTKNTDNQFPTQQYIDRIAKYTDQVYVTSTYETYEVLTDKNGTDYIHTEGYKAMNGNVVVSCNGEVGLFCSNSYTKLKDSEWFRAKVTLNGVERTVRSMPEEWK